MTGVFLHTNMYISLQYLKLILTMRVTLKTRSSPHFCHLLPSFCYRNVYLLSFLESSRTVSSGPCVSRSRRQAAHSSLCLWQTPRPGLQLSFGETHSRLVKVSTLAPPPIAGIGAAYGWQIPAGGKVPGSWAACQSILLLLIVSIYLW